MTKSDIRLLEATFRMTGKYSLAELCVKAIEGDSDSWAKVEKLAHDLDSNDESANLNS